MSTITSIQIVVSGGGTRVSNAGVITLMRDILCHSYTDLLASFHGFSFWIFSSPGELQPFFGKRRLVSTTLEPQNAISWFQAFAFEWVIVCRSTPRRRQRT
jgi:hypothetical protein